MFGFHTTWGAFSYPCIFILTDLTTRVLGAKTARKVIFWSMFPSFVLSYALTQALTVHHDLGGRIAGACLLAYVAGQLLDIVIFQRYRTQGAWWLAPSLSGLVGTTVDTLIFFFVAFYGCSNPFLSQHWFDIACVDWVVKVLMGWAGVPMYGVLLHYLSTERVKNIYSANF